MRNRRHLIRVIHPRLAEPPRGPLAHLSRIASHQLHHVPKSASAQASRDSSRAAEWPPMYMVAAKINPFGGNHSTLISLVPLLCSKFRIAVAELDSATDHSTGVSFAAATWRVARLSKPRQPRYRLLKVPPLETELLYAGAFAFWRTLFWKPSNFTSPLSAKTGDRPVICS